MSKYGEVVALLEYFDKKNKPVKSKTWRMKDEDPIAGLLKYQRMMKEFEAFQKDQEKLNKKEDKKGWDGMSFVQKMTLLTVTVPLATMCYGLIFVQVFVAAGHMLGMK